MVGSMKRAVESGKWAGAWPAAEPPAAEMHPEIVRLVPYQRFWGLPRIESCSLVTIGETRGRA